MKEMYGIVLDVIAGGGYDLTDLHTKIEALWVQGRLTTEEKAELMERARDGASAQHSADLFAKLQELEARVKALEEGTDKPAASVEDFVEGRWYYNGDKCNWNGTTYTCIAPAGQVCVWSPEAYPAYWEAVTK